MISATETITIGGLVANDSELLLIVDQTPTFSPDVSCLLASLEASRFILYIQPFDGILGLGPQLVSGSVLQAFVDQGLAGPS